MQNINASAVRAALGGADWPRPAMTIMTLSALVTVVGVGFALHALIVGHEHTFGTSREVPWGLLIPSYVFFATISTGLTIIASLGQVFEMEPFKPLVRRAVLLAAVTIAAGLLSISLELENPWRVSIHALLSPHPSSNIWWKTSIFSMYLMLLVFNFILLQAGRLRPARIFGTLALAACLATNLNMKEDMAMIGARGFWPEQYMAIYFISLAVLLGGCALLLFHWYVDRFGPDRLDRASGESLVSLGKLTATMLMVLAFFVGWKVLTGITGSSENPEVMHLVFADRLAVSFWVGEVALAVVLPLGMYFLLPRTTRNLGAMAATCLVGLFATLYNMVIAGQLVPRFSGMHINGLPRYLHYAPSLHEVMMFLGAAFLVLALGTAGELYFRPGRRGLNG